MISISLPEQDASLVGYAALIKRYDLKLPLPSALAVISSKHRKYRTDTWQVFTPRYGPEDTLKGHLTFALKYEGVDLAVLNKLFEKIPQEEMNLMIQQEPNGRYARRLWFLFEWLRGEMLDIPDAQGAFEDLLDETLQYPGPSRFSKRHRIRNNLPGVKNFCPLIKRTQKLDAFIAMNLSGIARENIGAIHPDLLVRAAAFLLLEDSRASYAIEGETPPQNRAERWAHILGQAGKKPISRQELERLQQEVMADARFMQMGYREQGGFIGVHDSSTGMPIPAHISARAEDLNDLMTGLIETAALLKDGNYPHVLAAAAIGFGFVFIHPFEDGNGRLHRYILHHILAESGFMPPGVVFPVSAVILERLTEYRTVLEGYSRPRLPFIEWRSTDKGNVDVLNQTMDLYRYFDATAQAEFFYECVYKTVSETVPNEVSYLEKYDKMKAFINNYIDMPNLKIDRLIRFLSQNQGRLSNRARSKEFEALKDEEIHVIESKYSDIF
jgi:hypothetical protein